MDWDQYRNNDNSINLVEAWLDGITVTGPRREREIGFLEAIQDYQPIRSRQVAALALAMADFLD